MRLMDADESMHLVRELQQSGVPESLMAITAGVKPYFLWKVSIGGLRLNERQYRLLMNRFGHMREVEWAGG